MNSQQSLDLWQDISLPQWIVNDANNVIQNSFPSESLKGESKNIPEKFINNQQSRYSSFKRTSPLDNQSPESDSVQQNEPIKSSESLDPDSERKEQKNDKKVQKNKLQRRCQNSRKYRQRKRQYVKSLQDQNILLKSKVDELTFRLNQLERQINRIKHNDLHNKENFHTGKLQCLKQAQDILQKNQAKHHQLIKAQSKLEMVMSFDNKQKIDYLNYLMSELLQNVINNRTFYFIDCLINKKGVHRQSKKVDLRRIDVEVINLLDIDEIKIKQCFTQRHRINLAHEARRLKQLWKKLYQVYLAILNQGMKLQRIIKPMKSHLMSFVKIQNFLRVDLHFENNKYRSDIRYLRNSWFKQIQHQQTNGQKQIQDHLTKKIKVQ